MTFAVIENRSKTPKSMIFDEGNGIFDVKNELRSSDISSVFPVFFDDFESGLDKWQNITGLWHLTGTGSAWPDPCHSPTHAMWFGNESTGNFETGYQEYGDLISVPFSLIDVDKAGLEFYHWREGEGGNKYDFSYVYISTDGINWDLLYQNNTDYISPWERVVLDISKYAGNVSVQLRFYFDTLDAEVNEYRGWLVDDVRVLTFHDLSVSLNLPLNPQIYHTNIINGTVYNTGNYNETNIDLFLYLDDELLNSTTIPSLSVGTTKTVSFPWIPTQYGEYNFTAYISPVPYEEYIENNMETKELLVFNSIFGPVAIFRNLFPWGSNVTEPILNMYGIEYTVYSSADMGTVDLSPFEKVIIESDQDQLFYDALGLNISWFESYTANGGILEIHAADDGWNGGSWDGLYLMPGDINQTHISSDNITINLPLHPILLYPNIITDAELDDWDSSAHGYFNTYPVNSKEILLDGDTLNPVFIELDYGEGTILITMQTLEFGYDSGDSNFLENVILFDPDSIMITAPNSSSSWKTKTSQYIHWTSTGAISNVKIELYKEGIFVMEINSSTPNDGEFYWKIPSTLEKSDQYQIKIIDASNPSTFDYSDYFEITRPARGPPVIPGYSIYILIGIVCVVSLILIKKRFKLIK